MSTNDQRAVRSGRTSTVSKAVARRCQQLRLVLEYLRSTTDSRSPGGRQEIIIAPTQRGPGSSVLGAPTCARAPKYDSSTG
jgi:hypothetical protein